MAIKEAYTTRELVDLLSVSQQAIAKRASREGWQSRTRKGRGGGHEWLVDSMPESTVQAIKAAVATQEAEAVVADVVALEGHEKNAASAPACATVPDKNLAIARARHRLVREWRAYMERGKVKAISARELSTSFVIGYNSGILNLPDWVREIVKAVSEKTLYRWESTMNRQAGDLLALADRRGSWTRGGPKGLGQIGEEAESFFLKAYLQPTKPSLHLAWMASCSALERRGLAAPSYSSTLRFFQRYDSHNHDIVLWMREGNKALKDKVAPYLSRDSRILEVGDILVADGHKMNFMVINPETGKPCRMTLIGWQDWASGLFMAFEIMLSENTQAIAASLYRAIMSLGKIPRAVYIDNGEAFKNKFFENENSDMEEFDGLYLRLGIHVQHSLPYEARAKVIERWWGDFDRQAAVLMDSYVGNSIDNKPAYLKRNEKWLSERHSDYTPTVDDVKHLVTEYAKWKAAQPHPTRPGSTPWSVFSAGRGPGFSEGEKADLARQFLYRREVTPSRCRIRMHGMEYESDALYGINKSLLAYYSYSDMSEIHIYDGTRSLGVARPVATVNPLAAVLGGELDMQQISQKNKEFAKLRRQTRDIAGKIADFGGNALMELPYMQGVAVRRQPLQHITGKQQPSISFAQESPQISAAEAAQLTAIATAARIGSAPSYTVPAFFGSELERYDYLFLLVHEQGVALTQEDAAFMTNYEVSDEFQYTGPRYTQLKAYYARTQQAQGA